MRAAWVRHGTARHGMARHRIAWRHCVRLRLSEAEGQGAMGVLARDSRCACEGGWHDARPCLSRSRFRCERAWVHTIVGESEAVSAYPVGKSVDGVVVCGVAARCPHIQTSTPPHTHMRACRRARHKRDYHSRFLMTFSFHLTAIRPGYLANDTPSRRVCARCWSEQSSCLLPSALPRFDNGEGRKGGGGGR
jgi:hypothetical protein